jgi:nitrate/TMAO reductase-like tetraheme cytochrome c subunit
MNRKQTCNCQTIIAVSLQLCLLWLASNVPVLTQGPVIEENELCLICHSNPDLVVEFADGSASDAHISSRTYMASVHGQEAMTCGGYHPNHEEYPHPELTAPDSRAYTLELNEICANCHPDHAERVRDSNHARAMAKGHPEAAVCVDCHVAHDTVSLRQARVKIATPVANAIPPSMTIIVKAPTAKLFGKKAIPTSPPV